MKSLLLFLGLGVLCTMVATAERRTFTNKDGKSIEAELVAVSDDKAVLRLPRGRTAKVPLESLSPDDQSFVKSWWEANKNKLNESDVRLTIDKNTKRLDTDVSNTVNRGGNNNRNPSSTRKRRTLDEYSYTCTLENRTSKEVDITAKYTIYKRISTRGEGGSDISTEEIDGSANPGKLEASGKLTFTTDPVQCEDQSQKSSGGNKGTKSTRKSESIQGVVVTLSAGGKEFLKQSYPENFLDRLEEEEKRQEARDKERR